MKRRDLLKGALAAPAVAFAGKAVAQESGIAMTGKIDGVTEVMFSDDDFIKLYDIANDRMVYKRIGGLDAVSVEAFLFMGGIIVSKDELPRKAKIA